MRFVTVSGPPSSGKTAVILKTLEHLQKTGSKVGVVKFDCLSTDDDEAKPMDPNASAAFDSSDLFQSMIALCHGHKGVRQKKESEAELVQK